MNPAGAPAGWSVPRWTNDDLILLEGGVPASLSRCHDPLGARIFLAFRVLESIEAWKWGKSPRGMRGIVSASMRSRQRAARAMNSLLPYATRNAKLSLELRSVISHLARADGRLRHEDVSIGTHIPSSTRAALWFGPLEEIAKDVCQSGGVVLLQGSQADGCTTAFSDIDIILICDRHERGLRAQKQRLDDLLLGADPLQHHGALVVYWDDFDAYWERKLPLSTLRRAVSLVESSAIKAAVVSEPYGSTATLLAPLRAWDELLSERRVVRGLWDWKFLLSQLMLIPTLLLASGGLFTYKGDSFALARPLFSDEAWDGMNAATSARAQWPIEYNAGPYQLARERASGRLLSDRAPVPANLALWESGRFLTSISAFMRETKELAQLQ